MNQYYRDLLKHSGVYGVAQILSRLASVLLLPLYTRYLTPADYGTIAILDLSTAVLGVLLTAGIVSAVGRFHFEANNPGEESAVWWTGAAVVATVATAIVIPAFFARHAFSTLALGAEQQAGPHYFALALPTLWFAAIGQIPDQYMRVRKWSALTSSLSISFLLVNIALNVYLLTVLRLGVAGMLWGNLTTGVLSMFVRGSILVVTCRPIRFHWPLAVKLWRFGRPLVLVALLSMVMHEADRFLLRIFLDLKQVGLYSLAYTIGQGVNSFVLTPFFAIWDVVIYEIAKRPEARQVYVQIFEYFVYGLLLVLLGVSLFAEPFFAYVMPANYAATGRLVPIVCLAFVFFSIHGHFRVPALLAKRTGAIVLPAALGAGANVALNLVMIPRFGVAAAAWVSVATYMIFSMVGLAQYRRIDRFEYPFARCAAIVVSMIATFLVCQAMSGPAATVWSLTLRALAWSAWAAGLLLMVLRRPSALRSLTTAT